MGCAYAGTREAARLIDIDPNALKLCAEWGQAANRQRGRRDRSMTFTDRREALRGVAAESFEANREFVRIP